jgi:hypothetical protein
MNYELKQSNKNQYISLVLLNEIINNHAYPPVAVSGEDVYISYYLQLMEGVGFLAIKDGCYIPTDAGRLELEKFYQKYNEYLKLFDIFCAVDLENGTFAFEEINNPSFTDEQWADFLANERFSDVRVAVADFKGIDPLEIVFMSFLTEGRFEIGLDRWQYNLTSDGVWNEIEEICNTAVSREYLEEDGVLVDVITQGSALALKLIREVEDALAAESEETYEEVVEETVTEEVIEEYVDVVEMPYYGYDYYDPYYDPYYISPIWLVPVLLW